jgi:DNA-binding LytR/AlgR family response regulator
MHYRLAICEDQPADAQYVSTLVAQWAAAAGHTVSADTYPSAETFLFRYAEDKAYDILLLDIEMGAMNGVELAKTIRRDNREIQIVFITGYTDYIADGYDVEALHYLLKPVTQDRLSAVLDRATEKLARNERTLLLNQGGETIRVPLYEIRYLEVQQNYVTIHAREDYTVKKTLSAFEGELDDGFFRAGRSFLLNLRYISRITRTEVHLKDGARVPLAHGLYDALNRAMIRHF